MLKKTLLIAIAAASAAIAAAPAMAASNSPFSGFYAGAGVTRDTADFTLKDSAGNKVGLSGTGFGGNLFAGYGYTFCNGFYLGGEAFGSVSSAEDKIGNEKLDLKHTYGISVLPGYMITNNTLGYVRVGYARSQFKASGSVSDTANLNGAQYGVGLQTALANNLSLRAEYTYTNYQSKKYANGASFNPSTDQFGLSVAYNFG